MLTIDEVPEDNIKSLNECQQKCHQNDSCDYFRWNENSHDCKLMISTYKQSPRYKFTTGPQHCAANEQGKIISDNNNNIFN